MRYKYYRTFGYSTKEYLYYRQTSNYLEYFHPEEHIWKTSAWDSIESRDDNTGFKDNKKYAKCYKKEIKNYYLAEKIKK